MSEERSHGKVTVFVCLGTGCVSAGSDQIKAALEREIERAGLTHQCEVRLTGCHGFCQQGPIVHVEPEGIFYTHVELKDVQEIVESHLRDGKPVERLFYRDPVTGQSVAHHSEIGFYSQQQRVLLRNCGNVNPEEIGDYLGHGGYEALKQVLSRMAPGQVIDEVKRSGLRGRGGAGFPTGLKWEFCAKTTSDKKYVVCNADEGDPGAFMDRSILEADPHSVIEGLTIAGYAMGAHHGYIYVRAEYPLAVRRLRIALEQAREQALLGNNILQSGFSFDIEVKEGAGAFVCGEETALMASIEGRRGMPRPRPPFPAQSGLWGAPTNINNVKSLASIPLIIRWGANWFSSIGTEKSKGTAVFALTGKVANNGLIEVPMGTTLRHIIYEIGGGIPGNKRFKAVQTGGPSGGCLPASMLDLPVDYERLAEAGSIMGSGGMIVADEDTCIVDLAKFFLSFTQAESCGKCVPCRVGTGQMLAILERITEGQGEPGDLDQLERLAQTVKDGSLCALGGTAPNPVLTTLRYFREEYEEHIYRKRCPALMCKALTTYYILPDKCQGCMICLRNCPSGAIKGDKRMIHVIDQSKCTKCGTCLEMCPPRFGAVVKVSGEQVNVPDEPVPVSQ